MFHLSPQHSRTEKALPAMVRGPISTNNGNMAGAYISHRLTRGQAHGPGVLEGPTEREE